jgi:hypothetical protein
MSWGAMLGVVALNAVFLLVGVAVLFALRGWRSWGELLRLCGLAYMLGVAATAVVLVWALIVTVPFSVATVLVAGALVAVVAIIAGVRLGRRLPPRPHVRVPAWSVVGAVCAALVVVYSEAMFRAGRLASLTEFDGWFFWVAKARAIFFIGDLDKQFFRELPHHGYPPLVPTVEAAAMRFMGSPDVVTLHLQFWFLFIGFVAALLGLLAPHVRALFLWPPLLLVLATPRVSGYALQAQADFLVEELLAVAALLLALWLLDRSDWQLVAAGILLAAAMLSKREGTLFGACIVLAALGATWPQRRSAWPRLVAVGLAAFAATLPWWILLHVRGLGAETPEAGAIGLFSHLDLAWPSLKLTFSTLFDYHQWLVVAPVAVLAIAGAFAAGARRLPGYAALLFVFGIAALTYSSWAFPSIPITKAPVNPIIRLTGWLVLVTPAVIPLVLEDGWRGGRRT